VTRDELLTAIRTAAEERWPGQRVDVGVSLLARKNVAYVVAGTRGFASAAATETEALERLLAEVRR